MQDNHFAGQKSNFINETKRLIVKVGFILCTALFGTLTGHTTFAADVSVGVPLSVLRTPVYYPDAEVYFEPQTRVYYWSDGGNWRSGPRAPENIVLRFHVTVNLDSRVPYTHHDEIRARYPHKKRDERREEKQSDREQR